MSIPVIYSFARSGGTLVNQLLGVHPQCLLLSEVNPAASYKPIVEQAVEWLELVEPGEAGEFSRLPYREKIARLRERAAARGKRLIVRDWVTVNFLPGASRDHTRPSGELEQELYLESAGLRSIPLVVARRSAAVYRSIRHHFSHLRDLEADAFAQSYLGYARAVAEFPRIHLEALRAGPREALAMVLARFELDGSPRQSLLERFHEFTKCTGNITLQETNGSASARRILPPEAPAEDEIVLARAHPAFIEADRMLGYA